MLLHALHGGAALGPEQRAQIVVAPLDGPLQDAADIGAVAAGHVVRGDVRRGAAGRPQTAGEAARQVQQHLRNVIAVIAQGDLPLVHRLLHQLVIGLLQQVLEKNQMLQILHRRLLPREENLSLRILVISAVSRPFTVHTIPFFDRKCNRKCGFCRKNPQNIQSAAGNFSLPGTQTGIDNRGGRGYHGST